MGGLEELTGYETTHLEEGGERECVLNLYMRMLAKTHPYEIILYILVTRKLNAFVRHSA